MDAEMPYRHVIDGKASDLIELPTTFALNDSSCFAYSFGLAKPLLTPGIVEAMYLEEFEAEYEERGFCMFMLHPQLIGRPGRLRMLERVVTHMKSRGDVLSQRQKGSRAMPTGTAPKWCGVTDLGDVITPE